MYIPIIALSILLIVSAIYMMHLIDENKALHSKVIDKSLTISAIRQTKSFLRDRLDETNLKLAHANMEIVKLKEQQIEMSEELEVNISRSDEDSFIYDVTMEEIKLFTKVVSAEAGADWDLNGFMMLAQVTVNQWRSGLADTLYGVLTYPNNYSVIDNGRYNTVPINPHATTAVYKVLSGETILPVDVLYYCTEEVRGNPLHSQLEAYGTYKNVVFFKGR